MGPTLKEARPARYHSHKFNRAQRNYFTTEQELLGIVDALEAFQDLFIGHKFVVATDHQPLKYFWTQKNLSRRQHRWAQILAKFNFTVEYLPGPLNGFADGLSRFYEIDPGATYADFEYCRIEDDFVDQLGPLPVVAAISQEGEEESSETLDLLPPADPEEDDNTPRV
jgi:RNase H-like domain found in reverse transcriptase